LAGRNNKIKKGTTLSEDGVIVETDGDCDEDSSTDDTKMKAAVHGVYKF
jgi:hypothetical protein